MVDNEKKQRLLPSLAVNFFAVFTIVIFNPYDIFFSNRADFAFGFSDFWWITLSFGIAVFVALMLISVILPKRVFEFFISIIFALTLCSWTQRMFLNRFVPILDGKEFSAWEHPTWAVVNFAIWLCLSVAVFVLWHFRHDLWKSVLIWCSCALVLIQATGLVSLLISEDLSSPSVMTRKGMLEVGEQNIIVFCLDHFDNSYVGEIMKDSLAFFDELDGFTYFDNVAGVYNRSYPGHTFLLTGIEQDEYYQMPYQNAVDLAFEKSDYFDIIQNAGYDIYAYTSANFVSSDAQRIIVNCEDAYRLEYFETVLAMLKCELYSSMPYILKPLFWFYGKVNTTSAGTDAWITYSPQADAEFCAELRENGLKNTKGPQFKYIHLLGGHDPYKLNANAEYIPEGVTRSEQNRGEMQVVYEYLRRMKQLGVYDSSTIIITTDHGTVFSSEMKPPEPISPIIFYKPSGVSNTPFKISHAPVSHADIVPTLVSEIGGNAEKYGRTLSSVGEDEERDRIFHYVVIVDTSEYLLKDYLIDGYIGDLNNWHYTGKESRILYSQYPVLKDDSVYEENALSILEESAMRRDAQSDEISLTIRRKLLSLQAWLKLEGTDASSFDIYVAITDEEGSRKLYKTTRSDSGVGSINEITNGDDGKQFFSCDISLLEYESGKYEINYIIYDPATEITHITATGKTIMIDSLLGTWITPSTPLQFNNGSGLPNMEEISANTAVQNIGPWTSTGNEYVIFDGWIAVPELAFEPSEVFLAVTDETGGVHFFTTAAYKSEYLASQAGISGIDYGFYRASIAKDELPNGEFTVEAIVRYPEAAYRSGSKITMQVKESVLEQKLKMPNYNRTETVPGGLSWTGEGKKLTIYMWADPATAAQWVGATYMVVHGEDGSTKHYRVQPVGDEAIRIAGMEEEAGGKQYYSCTLDLAAYKSGDYKISGVLSDAAGEDFCIIEHGTDLVYDSKLGVIASASTTVQERNGVNLTNLKTISTEPRPDFAGPWTASGERYVAFVGWASAPAYLDEASEAFLSLTDSNGNTRVFTTTPNKSEYFAQEIGKSDQDHGFYLAYIPIDELPKGNFGVETIIQYPDLTCRTGTICFMHLDVDGNLSLANN